MIEVSQAWKECNKRPLLPETFVEISCGFTDVGAQHVARASGTNEAVFSQPRNAVDNSRIVTRPKYATFERNLWTLDGSRSIIPDTAPYGDTGYASLNDYYLGALTLSFPEARSVTIPGVTITWSSEFDEYPKAFTVTGWRGGTVINSVNVEGNTEPITQVDLELSNYDGISIEVREWCCPDRRARIDLVMLGHVVTFTKRDIISFSHEQQGCPNSGELPKNSVQFTLDNSDGRWNPSNPTGLERYLSERQRVSVRYGLDVDGTTEWINAGTFYLSEWNAPANGLEASFTARDIFEYLLNETYTGVTTGTLREIVSSALTSGDIPEQLVTDISADLAAHTVTIDGSYTAAEVVQMCANAAGCVVWQDRDEVLHITPLDTRSQGYVITSALSYSHPEMTLSKPLKGVAVSYGDGQTYTLGVNTAGETQTVDNPFVTSAEQAAVVAEQVKRSLETRKTVNGEFRADPRLDVFDVVAVESKYGYIAPVVITNVKYAYSGSFRGSYTGRVIEGAGSSALGSFILGVSTLGTGV